VINLLLIPLSFHEQTACDSLSCKASIKFSAICILIKKEVVEIATIRMSIAGERLVSHIELNGNCNMHFDQFM